MDDLAIRIVEASSSTNPELFLALFKKMRPNMGEMHAIVAIAIVEVHNKRTVSVVLQ